MLILFYIGRHTIFVCHSVLAVSRTMITCEHIVGIHSEPFSVRRAQTQAPLWPSECGGVLYLTQWEEYSAMPSNAYECLDVSHVSHQFSHIINSIKYLFSGWSERATRSLSLSPSFEVHTTMCGINSEIIVKIKTILSCIINWFPSGRAKSEGWTFIQHPKGDSGGARKSNTEGLVLPAGGDGEALVHQTCAYAFGNAMRHMCDVCARKQ